MKVMDREGSRFAFLQEKFSRISMEKLKACIADNPQIRELMEDPMFDEALREAELSSWQSLKSVVANLLGNHPSAQYEKEIQELPMSFCQLGASCIFCGHTWNIFQRVEEIWVKSFYQYIRIWEECYRGQRDVNFLADYCWYLKRDVVTTEQRRKSLKR